MTHVVDIINKKYIDHRRNAFYVQKNTVQSSTLWKHEKSRETQVKCLFPCWICYREPIRLLVPSSGSRKCPVVEFYFCCFSGRLENQTKQTTGYWKSFHKYNGSGRSTVVRVHAVVWIHAFQGHVIFPRHFLGKLEWWIMVTLFIGLDSIQERADNSSTRESDLG